jgi:hypothetical protein
MERDFLTRFPSAKEFLDALKKTTGREGEDFRTENSRMS